MCARHPTTFRLACVVCGLDRVARLLRSTVLDYWSTVTTTWRRAIFALYSFIRMLSMLSSLFTRTPSRVRGSEGGRLFTRRVDQRCNSCDLRAETWTSVGVVALASPRSSPVGGVKASLAESFAKREVCRSFMRKSFFLWTILLPAAEYAG